MPDQTLNSHKDPKARECAYCENWGDETSALVPLSSQASPPASTEIKGYLLMALSCVGFASTSFFIRFADEKYNFPTVSALFIRGFVQMLFSLLYVVLYLPIFETFNLSGKKLKLVALRGIAGTLANIAFYAALRKLPLGDTVTIFFCSPIITMILSSIFLGEPITFMDCISAVICFTGVALVARPELGVSTVISPHDRIIGSLYSVIAGVLASTGIIILRSLGESVHCMVSVFSVGFVLTISTILLGTPLNPVRYWTMKKGTLTNILGAVLSSHAQYCVTRAVQLCRAGPGTMIRNLDVPVSYILGMLFLNESLSLQRLFGSGLVIFGVILVGLRELLQS